MCTLGMRGLIAVVNSPNDPSECAEGCGELALTLALPEQRFNGYGLFIVKGASKLKSAFPILSCNTT